jgi:hypothetical protein
MSELHPTDEQLLLHAEGESEQAVATHVAGCAECAEAVEASSAGRHALRSAPLLELPAARREAILTGLPRRERRRPGRRFVGVALPLVALASVVAVVGLSGGGDPERTAEQMAAQDVARDAPGAALEAAPAEDDVAAEEEGARAESAAALRPVAGPPEEVARLLRGRGLDARVVDGAVEVRGAEARQVEEALRNRRDGPVEVRLP